MAGVCGEPATRLYYSQPSSTSFPVGYASCVDSSGGTVTACSVAASPCRFSAIQNDGSGTSVDFVVCVAFNSTNQCDREYMTDCSDSAMSSSGSVDDGTTNLASANSSSIEDSNASKAITTSTSSSGIVVDTPMLVAIIAGAIIVLGSIFFMVYVVRSRGVGAGTTGARKSDSDTDFAEVTSTVADEDLSPNERELSMIVLPMRPTLTHSSPGSSVSIRIAPPTPTYPVDETPVIRFPSQASSFFRGGSSVVSGRSVFSASVLNQGGAAVYAQRQLSSLFGTRSSRTNQTSMVQPIHSRTTATAFKVTSPPYSVSQDSNILTGWQTPAAMTSELASGREMSETSWSIGPGELSEDSLGEAGAFGYDGRSTTRLSVALESMTASRYPDSMHDVDELDTNRSSGTFFDTGGTYFSTDSDFFDETIRDQSTAIFVGDDDDDDEKEIEF